MPAMGRPYDDGKLGFNKVAKCYYAGRDGIEAVNQLFIGKAAWASLRRLSGGLKYACSYA